MIWFLSFLLAQGAPQEFDSFFTEFASKRDNIHTVEADFEQTVYTPDDVYSKTGRIGFLKPRKLAFSYDDPPQTLLMIDRTIYDYDVEVRQLNIQEVEELREAEALYLAFENNPERLRELYLINVINNPEEPRAACASRAIALVPKPVNGEPPLFKRTVLYLREADYLPCLIHVESNEDTEFFIEITNYQVNGNVEPDALNFRIPEGVSVVFNDILIEVTGPEGAAVPDDLPVESMAARVQFDLEGSEATDLEPVTPGGARRP